MYLICYSRHLAYFIVQIDDVSQNFNFISFAHIPWELNVVVGSLAKWALDAPRGWNVFYCDSLFLGEINQFLHLLQNDIGWLLYFLLYFCYGYVFLEVGICGRPLWIFVASFFVIAIAVWKYFCILFGALD